MTAQYGENIPASPAPVTPPPGWYPNPTGPGQRYWDGYKWTDSYYQEPPAAQPEKKGWGTGMLVVGYVFAFLGGLIGLIMGLVALSKPDKTTKMHGAIITTLSIIMAIVWIAISSSMGS